jgi:hypothetical protein
MVGGKGGRPGYNTPGNVVTGTLLGLNPAPFNPRTPAPAPTQPLNNNSNTAPSYIAGRVGASQNGAGVVRSERVLSHRVRSPFFTGTAARTGTAAEYVRARVLHGRSGGAREGRPGRIPVTASESPAIEGGDPGSSEGRQLAGTTVTEAGAEHR